MKKTIQNVWLLICAGIIVVAIPLLLTHNEPIEINLPHLTQEELAEKKKAEDQAVKEAQRRQKTSRMYACTTDDDCIIVDKDPCGCAVGPKGVTAVNANYVADFDSVNNTAFGAKTCPDEVSTEKECSLDARPVCKNRTCKIAY